MTTLTFHSRLLAALAATLLGGAVHAQADFTHPALRDSASPAAGWQQARGAAPQFVGHPASPRWAMPHANGEHPAVLVAARAKTPLDPNTFIVQPPATAHWATQPDEGALAVAVAH